MEGGSRMLDNEYKFNKCFREFVDAYCIEHGCRTEEAFEQDEVKQAWRNCTDV